MREIKFRGFDGVAWRVGDLIHDSFNGREIIFIDNNAERTRYSVKKETVGQYTGLKDSEGQEIYEGDIIESQSDLIPFFELKSPDYIVFHDGAFWLRDSWNRHNSKGTLLAIASIYNGIARCKVIGNIHDNPSLLEANA